MAPGRRLHFLPTEMELFAEAEMQKKKGLNHTENSRSAIIVVTNLPKLLLSLTGVLSPA